MIRARIIAVCLLILAAAGTARAVVITGTTWQVLYNHPDQSSWSGFSDDEFRLKNRLVELLAALQSNDVATLATFTFSGNESGAGRYLYEMDQALARGAVIRFVGDSEVDPAIQRSNNEDAIDRSLNGLASAWPGRFTLVRDDSSFGIVHHKLGLFDYRANGGGVRSFVSSMNFTGASSFQWNIAVDLEDPALYHALLTELEEHLAGRFHDDAGKSHAHDESPFAVDGHHANTVRFSPAPDGSNGGDNTVSAVVDAISQARTSIVFAINHLTLDAVRDALIAAADRGVRIHGSLPGSSTKTNGISHEIYTNLLDAAVYVTTNRVQFHPAYESIAHTNFDQGGIGDLIHSKYLVIDRLRVIHGSMNWTFSAMQDDDSNDETMLFLRHPGIAEAFLAQYEDLTGVAITNLLPPGLDGYDGWKLAHGVDGQPDSADPEGDGLRLWEEYTFGADPLAAAGVDARLARESSAFWAEYPAPRTGVIYRAEASAMIGPAATWSTNGVEAVVSNRWLRIRLDAPAEPRRFVRPAAAPFNP